LRTKCHSRSTGGIEKNFALSVKSERNIYGLYTKLGV
jgi:hypothetical protein